MGSPLTDSKGLYAALNNCAFVSTDTLKDHPSKPFVFLMDLSMLGYDILSMLFASYEVVMAHHYGRNGNYSKISFFGQKKLARSTFKIVHFLFLARFSINYSKISIFRSKKSRSLHVRNRTFSFFGSFFNFCNA